MQTTGVRAGWMIAHARMASFQNEALGLNLTQAWPSSPLGLQTFQDGEETMYPLSLSAPGCSPELPSCLWAESPLPSSLSSSEMFCVYDLTLHRYRYTKHLKKSWTWTDISVLGAQKSIFSECACVFSSEAVPSYVSQSVSFSQNKGTWDKLHPSCSHVLMNEMLVKRKKNIHLHILPLCATNTIL